MIETSRLSIVPLLPDELRMHIQFPVDFAQSKGLKPSSSLLKKEVQDAILNDLLPHLNSSDKDPLFYTMWLIIEKNRKAIIGGICFHGEPNENGEAEIGYGIDEDFQNNGYMSEAIEGLIHWAKDNNKIKIVKAETEKGNLSSLRVLEKNNFEIAQETNDSFLLHHKVN
jgi:[ribosomal protein S5]-alanine N-acetyltransferase